MTTKNTAKKTTKKTSRKPRVDVHEQVTAQIIKAIEGGAGKWQMPWHNGGTALTRPANVDTKNPYNGINIVALWVAAMTRGYSHGTWGTYRQWSNQGCQVRKGEKSSIVVFYKQLPAKEGESEDSGRMVARASAVFNAEQVDGYEAPGLPDESVEMPRLQLVERFVDATRADVRHGGGRAFYQRTGDFIQMPKAGRFKGSATSSVVDTYYQTLLHELTHWTGATTRCDRSLKKRFGDAAYAMEELVAELGAAFLCADLGISQEPREDHAAYIANWLQVLKSDNRAIFAAASQASKATEFLHGFSKVVPLN
jgi:antirestriction protein ArdC